MCIRDRRPFILRFNVQSFNILPSFNVAIVSQSIHNLSRNLLHLQYCSYLSTLSGSTHPLRVSEISSELILYITSPLHPLSPRLMQLNTCHTLHSWHEILTHSPTYWIFPPDSSQFAGCFLFQSLTITIYFCLSPNHAIICFTTMFTPSQASFKSKMAVAW